MVGPTGARRVNAAPAAFSCVVRPAFGVRLVSIGYAFEASVAVNGHTGAREARR